jgi:predicted Zn-dependent peptidase
VAAADVATAAIGATVGTAGTAALATVTASATAARAAPAARATAPAPAATRSVAEHEHPEHPPLVVHEPVEATEDGHQLTVLDSGVRVVTERMESVRSVALGLWIGTGSAVEDEPEAGLSHLIEHMLFRGTARYRSLEIDQLFDAMGAELNAGTGKETTSVYSRVLDRHLERALDVMVDMVWRPAFDNAELEQEREIVLEEIAMYEDDPQDKVFDVLGEAVFGGHPLGRAIIGRADVVGTTGPDALRAFHAVRYVPSNVVVSAAGSVDHDRLVALVQEAGIERAGASAPAFPGAPDAQPARVRFFAKDTEQYHVCLGAPGLARDDERRFALRVLDNILGGTSSSRLFQEVREKRGLAYSVYSFQSLYAGTGQIGLYLGTRPDNVGRALRVVADELDRFRAEPATDEELERSKENVKGRVLLALESTTARMNRLGSSVLADMPLLSVDEVEARIDAVTLEDLSELAGELLAPERLSAAGIGGDESTFRAALAPLSEALAA